MNIGIIEICGIVGALLILLGFYRTSIGKWQTTSLVYELDNFVGASLLLIYQFHYQAYISAALNIVWAIVAFKGLEGYFARKKRAHSWLRFFRFKKN